ncbi:MAG TPA: glutamate--tRNA ligase, partial [Bacillales bacterium]|nr:glutamate--tRNA ligase [Bacillales bacterium]
PEVLEELQRQLGHLEEYEPKAIFQSVKAVQKETGHKGKKLFMPVRVAATGQMHGPELPKALYLLGKETVLNRLRDALRQLA